MPVPVRAPPEFRCRQARQEMSGSHQDTRTSAFSSTGFKQIIKRMGTVTLQRIITFRCGENDGEIRSALLAKLFSAVSMPLRPFRSSIISIKTALKRPGRKCFQKRLAALVAVKVRRFPMLLQVLLYQMNQMLLIHLQIFNNRKMHQSSNRLSYSIQKADDQFRSRIDRLTSMWFS